MPQKPPRSTRKAARPRDASRSADALVGGVSAAAAGVVRGVRTKVVARLQTGEDISSATIVSGVERLGVDFDAAEPRDQRATVTTDDDGVLRWSLSLTTNAPYAWWSLTLTRAGDADGNPDVSGKLTDGDGAAADAGDTPF